MSEDDDDDDNDSDGASARPRRRAARLTTAHQIGTVFESASGRRLPARVESTRISLRKLSVVFFLPCNGDDVPSVGGSNG